MKKLSGRWVRQYRSWLNLDHPLGMCIFVPVVKSLQEMGFDMTEIDEKFGAEFISQSRSFPTMYSRFFTMSEKDQRLVFGNNRLYDLWKKEKFPLQSIVMKKNGMFVPKSASQVAAEIDTLGGISFPKAVVKGSLDKDAARQLILQADPVDRANKSNVLIRDSDKPKSSSSKFGDGTKELSSLDADTVSKAKGFISFHPKGVKIPWWDLNEYYRTLGIYRRIDVNGRTYFSIPKREYDKLK